jgi:anti-anti-sigma factor
MADWTKLQVERAEIPDKEILVYRLKGGLTGSPQSLAFLEQVQSDCRQRPRRLLIDMKEIEHLNSTGSGVLTAAYASVTNAGGRMCLVGLGGRAEAVLNVIRFLFIVGNEKTEEDGIRYLTQ